MPRRPASITQADIARAIRAAKQAGAAEVEVQVGGRLGIVLDPTTCTLAKITQLFGPIEKAPPLGSIYVAGFGPYIKIGWSTDIACRVYSIEQGLPEPLTLHASFPGTQSDERALHKRFSHYRLRGEWFRNEGEFGAWVAQGCPKS